MSSTCLCGNGSQPAVVWSDPVFRLLRCPYCSLMCIDPLPEQAELDALYSSNYYEQYYRRYERLRLRYFHHWLDYLSHIRKPGRLLDVGCGIGLFVEAAIDHGWEAYGVEPSPGAKRVCRDGLPVLTGTLGSVILPSSSFDLITFWDVLAHVRNPLEQLVKARELLVDDGVILIKTPNCSSLDIAIARALNLLHGSRGWLHIPAQIFHFSQPSLMSLLSQAGFTILEIHLSGEPLKIDFRNLLTRPRVFAAQMLRSLLRMLHYKDSLVLLAYAER